MEDDTSGKIKKKWQILHTHTIPDPLITSLVETIFEQFIKSDLAKIQVLTKK